MRNQFNYNQCCIGFNKGKKVLIILVKICDEPKPKMEKRPRAIKKTKQCMPYSSEVRAGESFKTRGTEDN